MIAFEFDGIFEGRRVPSWLRRFESDPDGALEALLLGGADLGHLGGAEPSRVLLNWLEGLGQEKGFVEAVDAALARWIERRWGEPVFDAALGSATLVAQAWIRAADLIAFEPRLTEAVRSLRSFMPAERRFLNALSEGPARDPEGNAWLAIARHQEDRSLLEDWWRLCTLPPDVPWFHGRYGIHGLRGLPREQPHREFPTEVAEGLVRLASALADRVEEGLLRPAMAESEFVRIAQQTEAAYPFPSDWLSFWRNTLQAKRIREERAESWIRNFHPNEEVIRNVIENPGQLRWNEPDPDWALETREIGARLERNDWTALGRASALLEAQVRFFKGTGSSAPLVDSACHFALMARASRPEVALEWAELARSSNAWNSSAWITVLLVLLQLKQGRSALMVGVEAIQRFPDNIFVRTGLEEALRVGGLLRESKALYRETVERFTEITEQRSNFLGMLHLGRAPDQAPVKPASSSGEGRRPLPSHLGSVSHPFTREEHPQGEELAVSERTGTKAAVELFGVPAIQRHVVAIDHVAIAVHDLEASIKFYTEVLGFELHERRRTEGKTSAMVSAVIKAGPVTFVLLQGTSPESQVSKFVEHFGAGVRHVAIGVHNLPEMAEELKAAGMEFDTTLIQSPGLRQIFSKRDPGSGVMYEFIERLGGDFSDESVQQIFLQLEQDDAY